MVWASVSSAYHSVITFGLSLGHKTLFRTHKMVLLPILSEIHLWLHKQTQYSVFSSSMTGVWLCLLPMGDYTLKLIVLLQHDHKCVHNISEWLQQDFYWMRPVTDHARNQVTHWTTIKKLAFHYLEKNNLKTKHRRTSVWFYFVKVFLLSWPTPRILVTSKQSLNHCFFSLLIKGWSLKSCSCSRKHWKISLELVVMWSPR